MISDSIKQKFIEADQSHIFTFEKELTETEILSFQEQLNKVDINLAQKLFKLNEGECQLITSAIRGNALCTIGNSHVFCKIDVPADLLAAISESGGR